MPWNEYGILEDSEGENEIDDQDGTQSSQTSRATEPTQSTFSSQATDYSAIELDEIDELVDEQELEQEPPLTPTPLRTLATVAVAALSKTSRIRWNLPDDDIDDLNERLAAMDGNTGMSSGLALSDVLVDSPVDTPMDVPADETNAVSAVDLSAGDHDNDEGNTKEEGHHIDVNKSDKKDDQDSGKTTPPSAPILTDSDAIIILDDADEVDPGTDKSKTPRATTPSAPKASGATTDPSKPSDKDNTHTPKPSQSSQGKEKSGWGTWGDESGTGTPAVKDSWGSSNNTDNTGLGSSGANPSANTSNANDTSASNGWGTAANTGSSGGPWATWGDSGGTSTNPGGSGNGSGSWGDSGGSGGNWSSPTKNQGRGRDVTGSNTTGIRTGAGSRWGWGATVGSSSGAGFGADASPAAPGLLPPMGRSRSGPSNREGGWNSRRGKHSDGPYAGAAREHRKNKAGGSLDWQTGAWGSGSGSWGDSGGTGWQDETPMFTGDTTSASTTTPQKNTNIKFNLDPSPSAHLKHTYTPDLHFSIITRDMVSFVNQIMTKLEFHLIEVNAKQELESAGKRYQTRKKELKAYIELGDDKAKKVKLLQTLDDFREEETRRYNSLVNSAHVAKLAKKDAIESAVKIVAQIISEEVQMGVLNALRLVGTGAGSATSPVDVSAVLGEMLKVAAPQIVKKFLTDIDQQCQPRMNAMTSTLKAKDAEISRLNKKVDEFEARVFNLEQMLTRIETVTTRQPTQSQDEPPQFQSEVQRENEVEEKPKIPGNGVDAPIEISDDEMEA